MTQSVVIGNFCSDFVIRDPPASDGPYYYRRINQTTNQRYYLTVDATGNYFEYESPLASTSALVNDDFRLSLTWDRFMKPFVDASNLIIPSNSLRMIRSNRNSANPTNNVVLFDNASGDVSLKETSALVSYTNLTAQTVRRYQRTTDPPEKILEQSSSLVYLVNDQDDNSTIVKKDTPMRYLIVNPSSSNPPDVRELDLFLPGVTENMVKQTAYRINKKTRLSDGAVSYSFDVFRSDSLGTFPSTSSVIKYVEITTITSDLYSFFIDLGDIRGSSAQNNFTGLAVTYRDKQSQILVKYVVTTNVFDKSVSDLYGDFSIGLFRLYDTIRNVATDLYLGYDCTTVTNIGTCSSTSAKQMMINDYFLFRSASQSCQFKMYNIGNDEYMIFVNDADTPSTRVRFAVDNTGTVTTISNPIVTVQDRGWQLEQVNTAQNTVRFKWNYPAELASVPVNKNYFRIVGNAVSMVDSASANIFVCVKCTKLDPVSGTCITSAVSYIDDDMNYATTPVPVSSITTGAAQGAPVKLMDDIVFLDGSGRSMNVTDDGKISFDSATTTPDRFFITQSGVITMFQKTQGVVFIGTNTATPGEILYAKYTVGQPVKFVYAVNPNVQDGFGWTMTDDPNDGMRKRVEAYGQVTPSPSTLLLLQSSASPAASPSSDTYLKIRTNLDIAVVPNSYDPETGTWLLEFKFTGGTQLSSPIQRATLLTGPWASVNITGPESSNANGIARIRFPAAGALYYFKGTISGSSNRVGPASILLPTHPPMNLTTAPTVTPGITSVVLSNARVANINYAGNVKITIGTIVVTKPYSEISSAIGTTVTGLTHSTTYGAPALEFINTFLGTTRSQTLGSGFTTLPAPPMVVTTAPTVTPGSESVTLRSASVANMNTGGNVDITIGTIVVNKPYSEISSATGTTVTGLTHSTTYGAPALRFKNTEYNTTVLYTMLSGFTTLPRLPVSGNIQRRVQGTTSDGTTVSNLPFVETTNSVLDASSGIVPVLRFEWGRNLRVPITTKTRSKVTFAVVFRFIDMGGFLPTIFCTAGQWISGSLHVFFIDAQQLLLAFNGADWDGSGNTGSAGGNDWRPSGAIANTSRANLLVITMDSASKTVRARMNGGTTTDVSKMYRGNIPNLFNASSVSLGSWDNDRYFTGRMPEFIMYDDVALSGSQLADLENYFRGAYPGNSFGTAPTVSGGALSTLPYTFTVTGDSPGVTVYYVRSTGSTKPASPTWIPVTNDTPVTVSGTTVTIAKDPTGSYYYWLRLEASSTSVFEPSGSVLVSTSEFYLRNGPSGSYVMYNASGFSFASTTVFTLQSVKTSSTAFSLVTAPPTPNLLTSGFSAYKITRHNNADVSSRTDTFLRTFGRGPSDPNIYLYAQDARDINNGNQLGDPAMTGGQQYSFKFVKAPGSSTTYVIEIPGSRYIRILPSPGSYHITQNLLSATSSPADATVFTLEF